MEHEKPVFITKFNLSILIPILLYQTSIVMFSDYLFNCGFFLESVSSESLNQIHLHVVHSQHDVIQHLTTVSHTSKSEMFTTS